MTRQQRALMLFALLLISAVVLGCAGNEASADDEHGSLGNEVRRALLR